MNKVFKELNKKYKNWKKKKIVAQFISVLSIYWPDGKICSSMGKIEGFISPKKRGKNGGGCAGG